MKKRATFIVIILVILGGIFGLRLYSKKKNSDINVNTAIVKKGDVKSYLSTTGVVKSQNSKDYYGVQAKVKSVNIKVGDNVNKGQVLIVFDIPTNISLKQAQIQYENALLQRDDTINQKNIIDDKIADLDKQIDVLSKNNSPQDQVQIATLKQQRASIQTISNEKIKQLQNQIELAKLNIESLKQKSTEVKDSIIAENDGVVTFLTVAEGSIYNGMQSAVTVADINNLKVIVSLGKYDATKVKLGQKAVIKNEDKNYNGEVSFIEPSAKKVVSVSGSDTNLLAEINIIDKTQNLKIEFDIDTDILLGEVDNVLKIPAESIKTDKDGNSLVYILENNKAKEIKIKTGLESDVEAQILDGLKEGDKVILNPNASIVNGVTVKENSEGETK